MESILFSGEIPGVRVEWKRRDSSFAMDVAHAHTFWEAYYLFSGECVYSLEQKSYPLRQGTFVLIAPNRMHRTAASGHERILFEVSPSALRRYEPALALSETETCRIVQLAEPEQKRAESLLRCVTECLEEKPDAYEEKTRLYLAGLFSYALDRARPVPASRQTLSPPQRQAERVIRFIERNYARDIALDDIAKELFISKCYLSHLFRKVTGFSVFSYVEAVRLQHARTLLVTTRLRVSEIAAQTGFPSQAHFNRMFLREAGMSPLQYRKANGAGDVSAPT